MKALVIVTRQPSQATLELAGSFAPGEFAVIVVVDDGSAPGEETAAMAASLRARGVVVARHAVPVGRGAAIRTGMHAALAREPGLESIAIADESHSAGDVARVAARQDAVVLGSRKTGADWRMRALTGIRASDPWAALRSVPARLIPRLLTLESRGAEFDLETLVEAAEQAIPIAEERIPDGAPAKSPAWPLIRFLAAARPERAMTRLLAAVCALVLAAVVAASIRGFAAGHLFQQYLWLSWGQRRFVHFGALFAAWSFPLLLMFPWAYASVYAAALAGATTLAEGPLAVGAVLFFLLSANTLGRACARRFAGKDPQGGAAQILHTLAGVCAYALLMTLIARIPVNYPAVWAALLLLPVAFDFRGVARRVRGWASALGSIGLPNWRVRAAFALLLFALTVHWFAALEPESSADGMTMHLAVCADIAAHHAFTFRPEQFLWAVMPMAADFINAIVYLIGGEAAPSLLNFALLAAIAALLYFAARRWLSTEAALLMAALFVSTPLVNLVTGSLFIENFVAAMILGALIALGQFHETGEERDLYIAAALGGTAVSAKFGALAFLLAALVIAAFGIRRRRAAIAAGALLLLFAAPPYLIAYAKTGNPVFPFLNARFPSPLLERGAEVFRANFTQPLAWRTPFDITFHTSAYLESLNGATGFQYLLLIPMGVIALIAVRSYGARAAAAVALIAGTAVMAAQPYVRYIYPAMPLVTIAFAALAARFTSRQRWLYYSLLAAAVVSIGFNIYFTPASGYYHKDFYAPAIFQRNGRARVIRENIPLRDVTIRFHQQHPRDGVLLLVEQDLADAGPNAHEYHWHEYGLFKQIAGAKSASELRDLFTRLGVGYFITRRPGPSDDLLSPWPLAEFIANCTSPVIENGRFYAARTTPECETASGPALEARLEGLPLALVSPGVYDDFSPALRFKGAWTRSQFFEGPFRHTVSYSDSPGDSVSFAFEGNSLIYVFTKSFNRGIAELEIDGAPHEIDLYAADTEWQSRLGFCCLGPGKHLAILRATGRKRAEAQDAYVDLDAFIVE